MSLWLLAGCGGGAADGGGAAPVSAVTPTAPPAGPTSPTGPLLLEIPHPQLAQVEEAAWEQIEEQREQLEVLRAAPGTGAVPLGEAYGALGMLYDAYGFKEAAEIAYLNAETLMPGDARWTYYLAHVYRDQGEFAEAARRFEQLLEGHPDDLPTLIWLGQTRLEEERWDEARQAAQRALDLEKLSAPALYLLGQVATHEQDYQAAADSFARALEIEPQAAVIRYPYAIALQRIGRDEQAREQLELRGQRQPSLRDPLKEELAGIATGARIHLSRGSQAMRGGDLAQAIAEFQAAVAADPASPRANLNLGAALAQAGRTRDAIEQLEKALDLGLSPANLSKAHFNLGALYLMEEQQEVARKHLEASLRWDPENAAARRQLEALGGPG